MDIEFFPNLPTTRFADAAVWAAEMERQGWHGVCASDHLILGGGIMYPHVFVTATQMACATQRIKITTSFCNNLFRTPVEFAQAALSLQHASQGRFEAGLGAGWAEQETVRMGLKYPDAPVRVTMYVEALQIVRSLLATGQCVFSGKHYQVDISGDFRMSAGGEPPPPLIASAGGPRAIREVTPIVDRVEVKAIGRATRGGDLDLAVMAALSEEEVKSHVERVKQIDPDKPVGIFLMIASGNDPRVKDLQAAMGNGYMGRFMGHPDDIARALEELVTLGVSRVQLTEMTPGSHDALYQSLFS